MSAASVWGRLASPCTHQTHTWVSRTMIYLSPIVSSDRLKRPNVRDRSVTKPLRARGFGSVALRCYGHLHHLAGMKREIIER
jgi:hypothetical protein